MIIDAHQHYWKLDRGDYGWLTPETGPLLYQDYMPADIVAEIKANHVRGTIVVQAAPTLEEILFLLELSDQEETMLGVVGWMDIDGTDFLEQYARLRKNPRFVGIRPHFPELAAEEDWDKYPQLLQNLKKLAEDKFPVELLVQPAQLSAMVKLLEQLPSLAAVVDHLGSPDLAGNQLGQWEEGLKQLAQYKFTAIKLSGLATGGGSVPRHAADLRDCVQQAITWFGAERIMYGSDWPVCLQAGGYTETLELAKQVLPEELTDGQLAAIFSGNAVRIYNLQP